MKLICIAHRGEAQAFIKNLTVVDKNFYIGDDYHLLITGEGILNVLTKLPYYIAKYEIDFIINFGIAGSLSDKLHLDEIVEIRTNYGIDNESILYQSYTSEINEGKFDIISTNSRVLNDEYAKKCRAFAHIVDREAWAIAKIANEYKLQYSIYKMISDLAGSETNCFDLKNKAQYFSESLYDFYLKQNQLDDNQIDLMEEIPLPFHASFTQRKKIESLIEKLKHKKIESIETILKDQKLSVKQKPQFIISYLENLINPINTKIHEQLKMTFLPLEKSGAIVQYDSKLDKKHFSLKMDINSQTNLDKLKQSLSEFSFESFENIMNGKLDV